MHAIYFPLLYLSNTKRACDGWLEYTVQVLNVVR